MHQLKKPNRTILIGHPFSTTGVGEQFRSHLRSAMSVNLDVQVLDVWGYAPRLDPLHVELLKGRETDDTNDTIRVFHINGDEIDAALQHLGASRFDFDSGYNIIVPAWELPAYPQVWAEKLKKFDEVWALSSFIKAALRDSRVDSTYIGQSTEVPRRFFLSRQYFGLREDAFCLLAFFDKTSFVSRKNPLGAVNLFSKLVKRHPFMRIQLVLKAKDGDSEAAEFLDEIDVDRKEIKVISRPLSQFETHSLLNACDCFVSLHRSEGFGRGTGEAMSLGRLALATGWSGNMDYMDVDNSLPVEYELVPLANGDYPYWEGQKWAQPSLDHALMLIEKVINDAAFRDRLCRRAGLTITERCGNRAVGLRMLPRLTRQ